MLITSSSHFLSLFFIFSSSSSWYYQCRQSPQRVCFFCHCRCCCCIGAFSVFSVSSFFVLCVLLFLQHSLTTCYFQQHFLQSGCCLDVEVIFFFLSFSLSSSSSPFPILVPSLTFFVSSNCIVFKVSLEWVLFLLTVLSKLRFGFCPFFSLLNRRRRCPHSELHFLIRKFSFLIIFSSSTGDVICSVSTALASVCFCHYHCKV